MLILSFIFNKLWQYYNYQSLTITSSSVCDQYTPGNKTPVKKDLLIKKRVRGYLNESHDCSSLTVPLPIPVVFEMVPI